MTWPYAGPERTETLKRVVLRYRSDNITPIERLKLGKWIIKYHYTGFLANKNPRKWEKDLFNEIMTNYHDELAEIGQILAS